ncbi:hypothetical protein FHT00_001709 [Sphingomonas insulae]|uniref:Uncharacterized protein n=1 Tax=Sphingomonas insulae TaxID=424800 RepID=A0ABN1HXT6_9SPHN|nr:MULTISPECIES: hypothetical protein [Sphingomonas]MCP4027825.1 hypothetical protein [Sphingomonas sp.]NIJ29762.1 hypothetical protein [Sphingomonas insulae]
MTAGRTTARRSRRSRALRILGIAVAAVAALIVGLFMLVAGVAAERR